MSDTPLAACNEYLAANPDLDPAITSITVQPDSKGGYVATGHMVLDEPLRVSLDRCCCGDDECDSFSNTLVEWGIDPAEVQTVTMTLPLESPRE